MGRYQNKTPPEKIERRNEEICETKRGVVGVPIVVEPVPVDDNLAVVLEEIRNVEVAIAVLNERMKCCLCHHPSNTLGVESNS